MTPINVKLTRAEKRGRKIILVIESDLYSDETFAITPFYDEGDIKNQLQAIHFNLEIMEKSGNIDAKVSFGNCLSHSTKGHSQLHRPLSSFYLTKKECALDWFNNEKEEYFTDEKIKQILKLWESEPDFYNQLLEIYNKRKKEFKIEALNKAKEEYKKALDDLDKLLAETSF